MRGIFILSISFQFCRTCWENCSHCILRLIPAHLFPLVVLHWQKDVAHLFQVLKAFPGPLNHSTMAIHWNLPLWNLLSHLLSISQIEQLGWSLATSGWSFLVERHYFGSYWCFSFPILFERDVQPWSGNILSFWYFLFLYIERVEYLGNRSCSLWYMLEIS